MKGLFSCEGRFQQGQLEAKSTLGDFVLMKQMERLAIQASGENKKHRPSPNLSPWQTMEQQNQWRGEEFRVERLESDLPLPAEELLLEIRSLRGEGWGEGHSIVQCSQASIAGETLPAM